MVHVTDALRSLTSVAHEHVRLVFCGGTSLSKAYGLIERMSEDVDLKIVLAADHPLSLGQLRSHLSALKHKIADTMQAMGFEPVEEESLARNANRYFASGWHYESQYKTDSSLRPHLSLEFTARMPYFAIVQKPLDYLTTRLAGQEAAPFVMNCVAVEETLAEKVLSFLRRFAEHRAGASDNWDTALVRHIYDVWCIAAMDANTVERAAEHFRRLVEYDRHEFTRDVAFVDDPARCLTQALTEAEHDRQTRGEYATRLLPLIYGSARPTFDEAFAVFKAVAAKLISTL